MALKNLRSKCLDYLAKNYDSWPTPESTTHTGATHCGFSWNTDSEDCWYLLNEDGKAITKTDLEEYISDLNRYPYTEETLHDAIIYSIPNGEQYFVSMSTPDLVKESAIQLFITEDMTSDESLVIRTALSDLNNIGKFYYGPFKYTMGG